MHPKMHWGVRTDSMVLSVADSGIFPWLLLSLMANTVGLATMMQVEWRGW
jgi:hypothetical protein